MPFVPTTAEAARSVQNSLIIIGACVVSEESDCHSLKTETLEVPRRSKAQSLSSLQRMKKQPLELASAACRAKTTNGGRWLAGQS